MNCGIKNGKCYCSSGQCFPRNWLFGFHFGQWMITKSIEGCYSVYLASAASVHVYSWIFRRQRSSWAKPPLPNEEATECRGENWSPGGFALHPNLVVQSQAQDWALSHVLWFCECPLLSSLCIYLFIYDQRLWPHIIWWVSHSSLWER